MIVPINNIDNIGNKKFTIQYTKDELDKIREDFLVQIKKYCAKVIVIVE